MLIRTSVTTIGQQEQGRTALDVLAERFTYHDRASWIREFQNHRLTVNGQEATPQQLLQEGDTLQYFPPPRQEPPVDLTSRLLESHGQLAFIHKAGNIPCHPAGCFFNHTLWAQLKEGTIPGIPPQNDIHFVSRLDRETSGLVLVAWSSEEARRATRALAMPQARKIYRVLVEGAFPQTLQARGWLWNDPQAVIRKRRTFTATPPPDNAKNAETAATQFKCLDCQHGVSLLEATLETGRTHQIRATLAALGFPVVGDKLYGVDPNLFLKFIRGTLTDQDRRQLRLPRQALHAYRLIIPRPDQETPLDVIAPMPQDLRLENLPT